MIRFIEQRFGVVEPNISAWRRAVCGDLSSVFNFADPDNSEFLEQLPETTELAERARTLMDTTTPPTPELPELPTQAHGVRPSRALPYALHVHASTSEDGARLSLRFENTGRASAVFHVYDRLHLDRIPRRYTVEPHKQLTGSWAAESGSYDLWILGPNGFHRHIAGGAAEGPQPEVRVLYDEPRGGIYFKLQNPSDAAVSFELTPNAYFPKHAKSIEVEAGGEAGHYVLLDRSAHWYDFNVTLADQPGYLRRFAGRVETGRDSWSDPALGGPARGEQLDLRTAARSALMSATSRQPGGIGAPSPRTTASVC